MVEPNSSGRTASVICTTRWPITLSATLVVGLGVDLEIDENGDLVSKPARKWWKSEWPPIEIRFRTQLELPSDWLIRMTLKDLP